MKIAAYQAPLLAASSTAALHLISKRVKLCESAGVTILCCPEAILGGLADYAEDPTRFALAPGQLDSVLAPLSSDTVTTIIGFTELADDRKLYNSAAVFERGTVVGVYRKLHPAIRRSVYEAGRDAPVFQVGELTFGIIICNDSNFPEPARCMAAQGAAALFIPTNNGLPLERAHAELVSAARNADIAIATEHSVWVIRADVAGRTSQLMSYGSSWIVDPHGTVVQSAQHLSEDLILAGL